MYASLEHVRVVVLCVSLTHDCIDRAPRTRSPLPPAAPSDGQMDLVAASSRLRWGWRLATNHQAPLGTRQSRTQRQAKAAKGGRTPPPFVPHQCCNASGGGLPTASPPARSSSHSHLTCSHALATSCLPAAKNLDRRPTSTGSRCRWACMDKEASICRTCSVLTVLMRADQAI